MRSEPISAALLRMEKRELILREKHEQDQRATRVRRLPAGQAKFAEAHLIALAHQNRMLAALPKHGRTKFLQDLEAIADACASVKIS